MIDAAIDITHAAHPGRVRTAGPLPAPPVVGARALLGSPSVLRNPLDFLLEQGCEYVQGFLFSRPMTVQEFQATLRSSPRENTNRGAAPGRESRSS